MKCSQCGGSYFGHKICIICKGPFYKRHPGQITCASKECREKRQQQMQKAWDIKNSVGLRGPGRFPNEYVICIVCGKEAQRIRSNQATCLSEKCKHLHGSSKTYRGLRAKHVYRDLG